MARRLGGQKHPVDDFLFEYYRLRPAQLLTWHPGRGFAVEGRRDLAAHRDYETVEPRAAGAGPVVTASVRAARARLSRIEWAIAVLSATQARPPAHACFGMHEWAMVLRCDEVRHSQVPLRVDSHGVADAVSAVGLRCTHFDAYRFFTPAARQLQEPLTRLGQPAAEQPGCIHAGMDLYRYAYESLAFVGSELVADCFEFARRAREIDMRASPYDLSEWGLEPIRVETPAGRREYVRHQQSLSEAAAPLRRRVLAELRSVRDWCTS